MPLQAFSIFFVCITITSDVACYLLIPVQWLFFTASTYVWVQYIWQTGILICLHKHYLLYVSTYRYLHDRSSMVNIGEPLHCVGEKRDYFFYK